MASVGIDLGIGLGVWGGRSFSPRSLFAAGEAGAIYDFSDLTTVFQDRSATPVTPAADGTVLGTVLDKSGNGNTLIAPANGARPILTKDGSLYCAVFDQVDDVLDGQVLSAFNFGTTDWYAVFGVRQLVTGGNYKVIWAKTNNATGNNYRCMTSDVYEPVLFRGTDAQASSVSGRTATQGNDHVLAYGRDATTDQYTLDAIQVAPGWGNIGVGSTSFAARLGGDGAATGFFGGRIYAAVIIDRFPTATERAALEAWVAAKSGLRSDYAAQFDYYVDSINGSDARSGLTPALAKQTFAATSTLIGAQSGKRVGFARASTWRERLSLTSSNAGTVLAAYGSGALPEIRCDDVVPNANFTLTAGRTNVYQVTLTVEPDVDAAEWPGFFENGVPLSLSPTSLITGEGRPGTYYHGTVDGLSSVTLYIHPYGDTNAITDGKTYEAPVRRRGIDTYDADGCTIRYLKGRRNYASYGSITVGRNGVAQFCEIHQGNTHNIYYRAGAALQDCLARDTFYPSLGPTLYIGFEATAPATCSATLTRCRAELTYNSAQPKTLITAITQANPGVITVTGHPYVDGDIIDISGVVGMTQINLPNLRVQNAAANTFTVQTINAAGVAAAVNTSGFGAYVSGGVVALNPYQPNTIGFYNHTGGGTTWDSITYTNCETAYCGLPFSSADIDLVTVSGGTVSQFFRGIKFGSNAVISGLVGVNSPPVIGSMIGVTDKANITYTIDGVNFSMNSTGSIQIAHTGCAVNLRNSTLTGCNQTIVGNVANQTWNIDHNTYVPNGHASTYNIGAGATGLSFTSDFNNWGGAGDNDQIIAGVTYLTFALYQAGTGQDLHSTG